jgi:hypothetical protein
MKPSLREWLMKKFTLERGVLSTSTGKKEAYFG